jgi:hypothetical protein
VGERTKEERVTFQHAFSFPGVEEQAPGTYVVEIVEETIDTFSFVAYRRVSTTRSRWSRSNRMIWRRH